jgi:hypothetical protein
MDIWRAIRRSITRRSERFDRSVAELLQHCVQHRLVPWDNTEPELFRALLEDYTLDVKASREAIERLIDDAELKLRVSATGQTMVNVTEHFLDITLGGSDIDRSSGDGFRASLLTAMSVPIADVSLEGGAASDLITGIIYGGDVTIIRIDTGAGVPMTLVIDLGVPRLISDVSLDADIEVDPFVRASLNAEDYVAWDRALPIYCRYLRLELKERSLTLKKVSVTLNTYDQEFVVRTKELTFSNAVIRLIPEDKHGASTMILTNEGRSGDLRRIGRNKFRLELKASMGDLDSAPLIKSIYRLVEDTDVALATSELGSLQAYAETGGLVIGEPVVVIPRFCSVGNRETHDVKYDLGQLSNSSTIALPQYIRLPESFTVYLDGVPCSMTLSTPTVEYTYRYDDTNNILIFKSGTTGAVQIAFGVDVPSVKDGILTLSYPTAGESISISYEGKRRRIVGEVIQPGDTYQLAYHPVELERTVEFDVPKSTKEFTIPYDIISVEFEDRSVFQTKVDGDPQEEGQWTIIQENGRPPVVKTYTETNSKDAGKAILRVDLIYYHRSEPVTSKVPPALEREGISVGGNTVLLCSRPISSSIDKTSDDYFLATTFATEPLPEFYKVTVRGYQGDVFTEVDTRLLDYRIGTIQTRFGTRYYCVLVFGDEVGVFDLMNAEVLYYETQPIYPQLSGEIFRNYKRYVNGKVEISNYGDYTVSSDGTIIAFSKIPDGCTASYTHIEQIELGDEDWQYVKSDDGSVDTRRIKVISPTVDRHDILVVDGYAFLHDGTKIHYTKEMASRPDDVHSAFDGTKYISIIPSVDLVRAKLLPPGSTRYTLDAYIHEGTVTFLSVETSDVCVRSYDVGDTHFCKAGYPPFLPPDSGYYEEECENPRARYGTGCPRYAPKSSPLPRELRREVTYVDGSSELDRYGDYSIDYDSGALFLKSPLSSAVGMAYDYGLFRCSYVCNMDLDVGARVFGDRVALSQIDSMDLYNKGIRSVGFIFTRLPGEFPSANIRLEVPTRFRAVTT